MSEDFSAWVGRSEEARDVLEPARSNALAASLGRTDARREGDALPPLHHWLYFWNVQPPSGLGADGHPAKGGSFLPPVALPRRMWAGGRLRFLRPLLLGERVSRQSTIGKVETKHGRTGTLVFVTVEHVVSGESGTAIVEEQDLVYRGAPPPESTISAPSEAAPSPPAMWCESTVPNPVLLFRYSALTMNGHRIHYDKPYAIVDEGYPGLVVHGPLQATMLADLAVQRLGAPLATFDFRGMAPAFDGTTLYICGEASEAGAALWTEQGGVKNMSAMATRL